MFDLITMLKMEDHWKLRYLKKVLDVLLMILYFKTASITGFVLSSTSVIDCVLDSTSVNDFVVTTI